MNQPIPQRPCSACGYDLSSHGSDAAVCPECGVQEHYGPPVAIADRAGVFLAECCLPTIYGSGACFLLSLLVRAIWRDPPSVVMVLFILADVGLVGLALIYPGVHMLFVRGRGAWTTRAGELDGLTTFATFLNIVWLVVAVLFATLTL